MDLILQIFWVNFLLFIWFDTDSLIEYARLFRLNKILKINSFDEYRKINPRISYHCYIRQNYPNFITKLITCAPCTCFWLVLLISLIFSNIFVFPILYVISYVIYIILKRNVYE